MFFPSISGSVIGKFVPSRLLLVPADLSVLIFVEFVFCERAPERLHLDGWCTLHFSSYTSVQKFFRFSNFFEWFFQFPLQPSWLYTMSGEQVMYRAKTKYWSTIRWHIYLNTNARKVQGLMKRASVCVRWDLNCWFCYQMAAVSMLFLCWEHHVRRHDIEVLWCNPLVLIATPGWSSRDLCTPSLMRPRWCLLESVRCHLKRDFVFQFRVGILCCGCNVCGDMSSDCYGVEFVLRL